MLCKECNQPVKYQRYCPGCKKHVSLDETVKGLEISKGEYLVFTKEELDKIKPEKSDRIEVQEFIDAQEIDLLYINKPYFIGPAKVKDRAYFLFRDVLRSSGKVAIGRFVMREKEYVCAIQDYKAGLILNTLNYKYEVRDINDIKELQEEPELNEGEMELAVKLVENLYEEEFEIEKFRDTFAEQLKEMIDKKEMIEVEEQPVSAKPSGSLLDQLKASLQE